MGGKGTQGQKLPNFAWYAPALNGRLWATMRLIFPVCCLLLLAVPALAQSDVKAVTDLLNKAGAAEQKNDFDGAIAAYSGILKLRPTDEPILLDRGGAGLR